MSRTAVSYRGEHVDPGNDVPVLVPGVVHEIDRVAHVVRPEKKQQEIQQTYNIEGNKTNREKTAVRNKN